MKVAQNITTLLVADSPLPPFATKGRAINRSVQRTNKRWQTCDVSEQKRPKVNRQNSDAEHKENRAAFWSHRFRLKVSVLFSTNALIFLTALSLQAQPALPEIYGPHQQAKALPVVKELRWTWPESWGSGMLASSTNLSEPWVWRGHILPPAVIVVEILPGRSAFLKARLDRDAAYPQGAPPRCCPVETNTIKVDVYQLGPE